MIICPPTAEAGVKISVLPVRVVTAAAGCAVATGLIPARGPRGSAGVGVDVDGPRR